MKIRNGFVSNSSSSSFVAAFPKKPKDSPDVWKFMFDGRDGGLSVYDYDGLSYARISSIVFDDLKRQNFKKATLDTIVEVFENRYYYSPHNQSVFWNGRMNDELGGAWTETLGRYHGNNRKLMEKLRKYYIDEKEISKNIRDEENKIFLKNKLMRPKYAYKGGIDSYTNKPYLEKEIDAQEKYEKAMSEFVKTNAEYIAFKKKERALRDREYKIRENLIRKIATEDAQNFLDDNKKKFIFIISYSDNDGDQGCTMEHGDVFRHVPHVKINQH